jgi:hypothetical protein
MQQEFIKNRRSDNPKKVISSPADIALQTVKKNKIQNDSPKFSVIEAIPDISVASDFTTHQ